jgi:hypothetical protein
MYISQKQGQDGSSLDDEQLGGLGLSFNSCIFLRSRARTAAAAAAWMSSWAAWAYLSFLYIFQKQGQDGSSSLDDEQLGGLSIL